MLEGEDAGGRAFIEVVVGQGDAVLVPLVAVVQVTVLGGLGGQDDGLVDVVVGAAAALDLDAGHFDLTLLEQLVVTGLGDKRALVDLAADHIALGVHKIPA